MANPEDVELLILDYLEGRMDGAQRARFEERLSGDAELRARLNSATRSVALVQQALGWVTPGEEFDEQVSSKIIDISQSGMRPATPASERRRSAEPDDPEAARERRRLMFLGLVAAGIFVLAAAAILYSIFQGLQIPPAPPGR